MSPRPTGLSLRESLENLCYEGKQMTVGIMPTGAPLTLPVFDPFKKLDWSAIQVRVKRLQVRIAKAVREPRYLRDGCCRLAHRVYQGR